MKSYSIKNIEDDGELLFFILGATFCLYPNNRLYNNNNNNVYIFISIKVYQKSTRSMYISMHDGSLFVCVYIHTDIGTFFSSSFLFIYVQTYVKREREVEGFFNIYLYKRCIINTSAAAALPYDVTCILSVWFSPLSLLFLMGCAHQYYTYNVYQ